MGPREGRVRPIGDAGVRCWHEMMGIQNVARYLGHLVGVVLR